MSMNNFLEMKPNDFFELSPQEFEKLCKDFLHAAHFENITHYGILGQDKGRDFTAELHREVLGHVQTEKWIIQCKRTKKMNASEICKEIAKISSFSFDHFLLLTSATLTGNTIDSLDGLENKFKIKIQVIDGPELCWQINHNYPELFPHYANDQSRITQYSIIKELLIKNRVIVSNININLDRFLNQYLELGYVAKIEPMSLPAKKFFVHPIDAIFHSITMGIRNNEEIKIACGNFLHIESIETWKTAVLSLINKLKEVSVVSLDWSDTLVDEVDLDEHICETLAKVKGPSDYQIDQYYRFNRILHSLHSRADAKWFDYCYLASLMGKVKEDVLIAHETYKGNWGLFKGAREFIDFIINLRKTRGLKIGIVTHCYRDFLYKRASLLNIDLSSFDFIVTGEEASDMTDKEQLLQKALETTKVNPKKFLHIGDNVARDILPANRLGCRSILMRITSRDCQTFWTSAQSPFSGDVIEIRRAQQFAPDWGLVSSFEQLQYILS
jgi:HAD superfamily hydrolase (TIGR01549 family)